MPVSIKGDTIVYNADSFKTVKNASWGRIQNSGFEVTSDGQVQVEGKKVTKPFVDGKSFMEGDS
jgi:hypothetical protein